MGTNYYVKTKVCEACGRGETVGHIGKKSHKSPFTLHLGDFYHRDDPTSLEEWCVLAQAEGNAVYDEYGERIELKDLLDIIGDNWVPMHGEFS